MLRLLRAGLASARALASDPEITFYFDDEPFDSLTLPRGKAIMLPRVVNIRSDKLGAHLRTRIDSGTAWIAGSNPVFDEYMPRDDDLALFYSMMEKARRECAYIVGLPGAHANLFANLLFKDHSVDLETPDTPWNIRYYNHRQAETSIMAQGIYAASLCALYPTPADLPDQVRKMGRLWTSRLDKITQKDFSKLFNYQDDSELYAVCARLIAEAVRKNMRDLKKPMSAHELGQLGINMQSKKRRRKWVGKSPMESHAQIVANRAVRKGIKNNQTDGNTMRTRRVPHAAHAAHPARAAAPSFAYAAARYAETEAAAPIAFKSQLTGEFFARFDEKLIATACDANITHSTNKLAKHDVDYTHLPEELQPEFVALAPLMAEIERPPETPSAGASISPLIEFSARTGDFHGAYRRLRGAHEKLSLAKDIEPDEDNLRKRWETLKREHARSLRDSRRLARKLEKWLSSKVEVKSKYEAEEGDLNPARLTTLITDPTTTQIYTGVAEALNLDAAVVFLSDHSGSMRGQNVEITALFSYALMESMERLRVPSEALAFTTDHSKSHHIAIKEFKDRLKGVSHHFGLASNPTHMGGTNDTDAILWALTRLAARPEKRKILAVVSDVDPNSSFIQPEFPDLRYDALLKSVLMQAERFKDIQVIGVGTGGCRNLERIYTNSLRIHGVDELAPALLGRLGDALNPQAATKLRRRYG